MTTRIFLTDIEFLFAPHSLNEFDCKGAFAYVLVRARDVREALEKLSSEAEKLGYNIIEVNAVYEYCKDAFSHETPDVRSNFNRAAAEVTNQEVVFADITAYSDEH